MRFLPVLGILLLLSGIAPGASARESYFRGNGLSFPDVLPEVGEALELVGRLDPVLCDVPFPLLPDTHEYTWTVYGPVVYAIAETAPGLRTLYLTFGLFELREDPRRNSAYSPFPPNDDVPSTFHDGETLLLGTLTDLRIREVFGILTAVGDLSFEVGKALPDLAGTTSWTLSAAISGLGGEIPAGYGSVWGLEVIPHDSVGIEATSAPTVDLRRTLSRSARKLASKAG